MKIAEINYNQVVRFHEYESVESAYADYFTKNITLVEAPPDVRIGWGYDGTNGVFIKPSADGHYYYENGETWLLIPNDQTSDAILKIINTQRKEANNDIIQEEIDRYTLSLLNEGVI